ncbi:MAG: META domain-containing protein [Verrucomicrobiota bacterium]
MKTRLVTLPFCLAALAACNPAPKNTSGTAKEAAPAPVAATPIVGGSWRVEDIEGRGVVENTRPFIRFDSATQVSGSGGVNRFNGPCTLEGDTLGFGLPRSTRMAGPPAAMEQERLFLENLTKVARFRLDENGFLHFLDGDGKAVVRLARSEEN